MQQFLLKFENFTQNQNVLGITKTDITKRKQTNKQTKKTRKFRYFQTHLSELKRHTRTRNYC